ncbi:YicC/YloC family endoribonuclease [Mesonia sp. K7]|uniref:YicC/YloC family endoribonuclease n=1 Tax=Mesonia sp. K7 TaxID=2218606 RepID=UPI000DA88689|nr:YicC/YloC family endoribonuclease [Mesonia sp. K7]PZD79013.1 YicC family protein [Mesonia sp. K7]
MILSMTGFGKAVKTLPENKITIEIKSLNSKSLDLNTRIPSQYREKELSMRQFIAQKLQRGKIDLNLYIESTGENTSASVNEAVVKTYIKQLQNISNHSSESELMAIAMRLPDTLKTEREEIDEGQYKEIEATISEATESLLQHRKDEGAVLEKEFLLRITNLKKLLEDVVEIDPERIIAVRERLEKGIAEIKENVDENRFEQELIFYIEKYDITEEKIRLGNHLAYFLETMKTETPNGKKLGFIGQEIGREINTIGSKSNYAPMQKLVVQMKDELEKIKEQLLNVL